MVDYNKKPVKKNPPPPAKPKQDTFVIEFNLEKEIDIILTAYESQYKSKSPYRYMKALAVRKKLKIRRWK